MLNRIRDLVTEVKGHSEMSRDMDRAIASGDREAMSTFRTGTFAAALTDKGRDARGEEVSEYARKVVEADGNGARFHRTFPRRDHT
ncbi:hypothetical protein AB0903_28085 [Streptomyces sp. NPDC048389]|uniref:hypothetical protein n=1 Tax=Streptomyces sp. NPDC048389 TaxID=3154622 RepID=UPI003454CC7F